MTDNRNAIDTALIKLSTACHYLELNRPSKKDVKCASEAAKDASDILKASLVLLDHDCYTVQDPPQAAGTPLFDPKGQPTPAAAQGGEEPQPERGPAGELSCAVIDVEAEAVRKFKIGDRVCDTDGDLGTVIEDEGGDEEEGYPYLVQYDSAAINNVTWNAADLTLVPADEEALHEPFPAGTKTDAKKVFEERLTTLEDIFIDRGGTMRTFKPHRDGWKAAWKADAREAWRNLLGAIVEANKTGDFTAWAPAA